MPYHAIPKTNDWKLVTLDHLEQTGYRAWTHCDARGHSVTMAARELFVLMGVPTDGGAEEMIFVGTVVPTERTWENHLN